MNSEQAFQNLKDSGHIYQQAHWFNTSEEKSNQIQQQREKKKPAVNGSNRITEPRYGLLQLYFS